MTLAELLDEGARALPASDSPRLDAALLLSRAAGLSRAELVLRATDDAPAGTAESFRAMVAARAAGHPVAYILGTKEFWGMDFEVSPAVLVPRPETEHLVEVALRAAGILRAERAGTDRPVGPRGEGLRVHDAFTGSGCVGISLAKELPGASVSISDISPEALETARANARCLLGGRPPASIADGLPPGEWDIVTANPPYVEREETARLIASGWKEPGLALDGGGDGLDPYRALAPRAAAALPRGGFLLVEHGAGQAAAIEGIFGAAGFGSFGRTRDYAGIERILAARRL